MVYCIPCVNLKPLRLLLVREILRGFLSLKGERERQRDRDRDRETEREREREGETDRQTDRQTDREKTPENFAHFDPRSLGRLWCI